MFVSMIKSKIPRDVLLHFEVQNGTDHEWSVQELKDRLRAYITASGSGQVLLWQHNGHTYEKKLIEGDLQKQITNGNNNKVDIMKTEVWLTDHKHQLLYQQTQMITIKDTSTHVGILRTVIGMTNVRNIKQLQSVNAFWKIHATHAWDTDIRVHNANKSKCVFTVANKIATTEVSVLKSSFSKDTMKVCICQKKSPMRP